MYRLVALVAFALSCTVPGGWAATLPPEKAISLDFTWLSPPVVLPDSAWGEVVRINDFVRLVSRPGRDGPSFTWGLRYPVNTKDYPVMVLRYSALRIGTAAEPAIALEMAHGGPVLAVADAAELKQGGAIQEFRKDLRPLTAGSDIGRVRFTLPAAAARLDVLELRFEPSGDVVPSSAPLKRNIELSVLDERDRPIEGATVLAGPLERANWMAADKSDAAGRVSLVVLMPPVGDQAAGMLEPVQPFEAAIMAPGFPPQYIPSISVGPNEMVVVRLTGEGESPDGWESLDGLEWEETADDVTTSSSNTMRGGSRLGGGPSANRSWGAKSPGGQGVLSVPTVRVVTIPTHEVVPVTYPGMGAGKIDRRRR